MLKLAIALAGCGGLMLLAGCASDAEPPVPTTGSDAIAQELELARSEGAAEEQIDALSLASDRGEVTLEQVRGMSERARECIMQAGFQTVDSGQLELIPGSAWYLENYTVVQDPGVTDDAISAVMLDCSTRYLQFIQSAFMMQPQAVELQAALWDTPEVRDCLRSRGFDIDADATGAELEAMASDDARAHAVDDPSYAPCLPSSPS